MAVSKRAGRNFFAANFYDITNIFSQAYRR